METSPVVTAFAALAHEARLAVFRLLVQAGPEGLPAGQLSERLGIPPSSLSFHLKELSRANLVSTRQQGRFVIYSANYPAMNELIAYLTENGAMGVVVSSDPNHKTRPVIRMVRGPGGGHAPDEYVDLSRLDRTAYLQGWRIVKSTHPARLRTGPLEPPLKPAA